MFGCLSIIHLLSEKSCNAQGKSTSFLSPESYEAPLVIRRPMFTAKSTEVHSGVCLSIKDLSILASACNGARLGTKNPLELIFSLMIAAGSRMAAR